MNDLIHDLRLSIRGIIRTPGITAAAVVDRAKRLMAT